MKKMSELVGLAERADRVGNLMDAVNPHDILAIDEAFRAMEQRAEAAEIEKAGAEERCRMMFDAKNHWADRARAAEAKLAELAKQEPIDYLTAMAARHSNEWHKMGPIAGYMEGWNDCLAETRAAPTADLA